MNTTGSQCRLARLAARLLLAWTTLVFITLPTRRYDWMQQIDANVIVPPENLASNATLFAWLMLTAVLICQTTLIATAKTGHECAREITLMIAATLLFSSRFWH